MSELRGHRRARLPKKYKKLVGKGYAVTRRGKHVWIDGKKERTRQ